MVPALRQAFNAAFTQEKYQAFLHEANAVHPGALDFRLAETPVFVPRQFTEQMLETCERIVDVIKDPRFKELTDRAIPAGMEVPGENEHTHFIAFDFGVCVNEDGDYEPQLIEMQGFPTLFAFEVMVDDVFRKHFHLPAGYSAYLGGLDREQYIAELKKIILGNERPEHVILLEILPHQQKTRIDFHCTEDYTGVKTVCLTDLIVEGRELFYLNNGIKTKVKRIYNRVIFDDLLQQSEAIREKGRIFFEPLDVAWVPHPAWFYRISKFTLPLIRHPFVPPTFFLDEVKQMPTRVLSATRAHNAPKARSICDSSAP